MELKKFVQIWLQRSDILKNRQIHPFFYHLSLPIALMPCRPQQPGRDSKTYGSHTNSSSHFPLYFQCSVSHPPLLPQRSLSIIHYLYPLSILSFHLTCSTGFSYQPFKHAQVSPTLKQGNKTLNAPSPTLLFLIFPLSTQIQNNGFLLHLPTHIKAFFPPHIVRTQNQDLP